VKFVDSANIGSGRPVSWAVAVVALLLFPVPASRAGKADSRSSSSGNSVAAKGEWLDCNTVSESRQEGDNQLITAAITEKFTGTLNGTYEGTERNVVHIRMAAGASTAVAPSAAT
jgi:hypothetical protein